MATVWEKFQTSVQGKRVLIFGLGIQGGGVAAANTLVRAGAQVRATDLKTTGELAESLAQLDPQISGSYGGHKPEDIDWADIILKNPGVPFSHPLVKRAAAQGKLVVTETAWALTFFRDQAIGVTGTRGKTTTSHLIFAILEATGKKPLLCGNIPQKPALSFLPEIGPETPVVVEISSFHLESCEKLRVSPRHAVVTNVYPDHLNRYETLEGYARTKAVLYQFQQPGDHAYFGAHHDWTAVLEQAIQPGVVKHVLGKRDFAAVAEHFPSLLPGEHNRENIAFAAAVAWVWGVGEAVIREAIAGFAGVPYRLEPIANKSGVTFINDTTSTTPVALEKALDAMTEPYVLIAGGTTKHLPLGDSLLAKLSAGPQGIVWLEGSGTKELRPKLEQPEGESFGDIGDAVAAAFSLAIAKRIPLVLFSPGFASFEHFRNEFDRGEQFNRAVRALPEIEL